MKKALLLLHLDKAFVKIIISFLNGLKMNTKLQDKPDERPATISRILEKTRDSKEKHLLHLASAPAKSSNNKITSIDEKNLGAMLKQKLEDTLFNDSRQPDLFSGKFFGPEDFLVGQWTSNFLSMVSPGQLPRFRSKDFLIYPGKYSVSAGLWLPYRDQGRLGFIPCITQIENEYMQELPDKVFNLVGRYLIIRDSKDIVAFPRGVLALFRANGEVKLNQLCLSDFTAPFWKRIEKYQRSSGK